MEIIGTDKVGAEFLSFRPRSHARKGNASSSKARFLVLTSASRPAMFLNID